MWPESTFPKNPLNADGCARTVFFPRTDRRLTGVAGQCFSQDVGAEQRPRKPCGRWQMQRAIGPEHVDDIGYFGPVSESVGGQRQTNRSSRMLRANFITGYSTRKHTAHRPMNSKTAISNPYALAMGRA